MKLIKLVSLLTCCIMMLITTDSLATSNKPMLIYSLSDGDKGVDGLNNPRMARFSDDASRLFVVSGDDNSLAIFDVHEDYSLTLNQVFKNQVSSQYKLEGASDLVLLNDSSKVAVTSFYDGALSVFDSAKGGDYKFVNAFSDNLPAEQVFKSELFDETQDKLGLLGAWGAAKSGDNKQVFVASYKSNTIALFDVNAKNELAFNRLITDDFQHSVDLGNPVSVAYSHYTRELIIAGFEKHKVTVLSQLSSGKFAVRQKIANDAQGVKSMLNPQKLALSSEGKFLYVASAGSNTITVFNRVKGQFSHLQTISNSDIGGAGLNGVGSLAISAGGKQLLAAGESDIGLLIFDIDRSGRLNFDRKVGADNQLLSGISSIDITKNDKYAVMTLAKKDAIHILSLK